MLEFQEGFFDQEVRDGFYLDATMKTLWAAELEVLQKVAEVCDRHGLKWYAACGTLLGAIRHEGFVPWDDDMDIWVKRADYNTLMWVLPQELPKGYLVRSPLTDAGYDQYHTCLNSGDSISIAKEWLEQFHGCPFTVGMDIFPLDYLPRDEKAGELQMNLLAMTGRIAQLARNVGRGNYDSEEDETEQEETADGEHKTTQKESVIEEIKLGIDYLEENCKLEIDHQLLEDGAWERLSSELWKWANYLAMMYEEEESDYLVETFDYVQSPHKKYPKEWFADGYSATFENFMIPVPAGYDNILRYLYGTYLARRKRAGSHDYPFYARQLRQLREYVKNIQQRAQDTGLVSIDQIEVKEETKELLPEWIPLTLKADGSRKKIVLSANDPAVYVMYGDRALNKLEETLHAFEQANDSVLLWWRPQPVMRKVLDRISPEAGQRYQGILDRYKEAGWGICDESDNIDRAVEVCDIYYGDMNAILQPFQNAGKAIMLTSMESEANGSLLNQNNADRINEYRAYLSLTDYVEDADKVYFANANYNAMVVVDKKAQTVVEHVPFEEIPAATQNMHLQCVQLEDKICFLPAGVSCMHVYDMTDRTRKTYDFPQNMAVPVTQGGFQETWGCFCYDGQLYLMPSRGGQDLWKFRIQEPSLTCENWWKISLEDVELKHETMDDEHFCTLVMYSNRLYITNVAEKTIESYNLPDDNIVHIAYDGQNFWYTSRGVSDIVCWNRERGIVDRYLVPQDLRYRYGVVSYLGICSAGGNLFLLSGDGEILYVLDQDKRELKQLYNVQCVRKGFAPELMPHFKHNGNQLICMLRTVGEVIVIDTDTLEVKQFNENFRIDASIAQEVRGYIYGILLDKKALLFEEADMGLDFLLQYCGANDIPGAR